jgi:hypothetical protein
MNRSGSRISIPEEAGPGQQLFKKSGPGIKGRRARRSQEARKPPGVEDNKRKPPGVTKEARKSESFFGLLKCVRI